MKAWPILTTYGQRNLLRVAMPLGGIGTGTVSIGGRGNLCDWEIMNRPGKDFSPWINFENGPFFAVCAKTESGSTAAKMLEGPFDPADFEGPGGPKIQNHGLPRFQNCEFRAAYPLAQVALSSPAFPLEVTVQAFNPLIPADVDASSLPVAVLRYVVNNTSGETQQVTICGTVPNFVGMDGRDRFVSNASKLFFNGSCDNVNTWRDEAGLKGILMASRKADTGDDTWGTIALSTPGGGTVTKRLAWLDKLKWNGPLRDFWDDFTGDGLLDDREQGQATQPVASLAVTREIAAGGEAEFTFFLTWHFPNRYDWTPEKHRGENYTRTNVGNHYCMLYDDAWDAAIKIHGQLPELEERTLNFVETLVDTDLPQAVKEAALNNLSTLRSQTCFRTADGHFFGFEGSLPHEGSCYGNSTHVWNYEQATAFLFGDLSRTLRELEFLHATADDGMMNFRINLPLKDALGFGKAAADGQMGCIMKLYRDWQLSGDDDLLKTLWPKAKKALEFCWMENGWDADQDGVMEGCQHNTMDVEYYGPNPQITGWYLGALKATAKMADYLGEADFSATCLTLFEQGSRWMDEQLFNGSYYIQKIVPPTGPVPDCLQGDSGAQDLNNPDYQLAEGCLVDQLVGQYMAHICDLGYLHDPAKVKTTLCSIYKLNRRENLWDHFNTMRTFALGDEGALLMAAYPEGKRPKVPFPYYSEVMTGFEYTAAVGMIFEGLEEEGLQCIRDVRNRFDGAKRSPFDEAECGHHYVRGMASWAAVLALTGFHYSAVTKSLQLANRPGRYFWSNGTAWGRYRLDATPNGCRLEFAVAEGAIAIKILQVGSWQGRGNWHLSVQKCAAITLVLSDGGSHEFEDYHGHQLYRFPFAGTEAIIVQPAKPRRDRAWLWKGCYFSAFPTFDLAMLDAGFRLVHVVPKTMFPTPETMRIWDQFYAYLTAEMDFPAKAILFGLSRGGFYIYTWATKNPEKVSCLYGDNPMCDFKSTYKGTGQAAGMPDKWARLVQEFGFASEQEALDSPWAGPIDDLEPLAAAGVPIIHVAATDDQIVPYEENTVVLAKRYQELGGKITVISHPGKHHPHGLEDPSPVIDFITHYTDLCK